MLKRFIPPYKKYLVLSVVFNILSAVLNIFSFAALIPILGIIFKTDDTERATALMAWDWTNAEEVKIRRLNELIALQTEQSALQNKKDEGREFDVLVEGFSKRSREQLCGRTEQNKMVVFDRGQHHIGETVRVRITGSTSATLLGEAVANE